MDENSQSSVYHALSSFLFRVGLFFLK